MALISMSSSHICTMHGSNMHALSISSRSRLCRMTGSMLNKRTKQLICSCAHSRLLAKLDLLGQPN